MRTARPVGLTDDGRFLTVETADGESILVPADESRTALRSRPRRHLETEMEQSMTPREIQMKIRAGASVEEIAESSGMPLARVEAFAAPVIAERNHIAGLAQTGSVRRAGEPTGHRTLRAALGERLRERGVDPDTVEWDAFKMDDGRWSVSAGYRIEQADRVAVFYFDQRGRFSVPGNDEGRWAIGEQPAQTPDSGSETHPEDVDTEPTLKLAGPADELALLRAIETDEAAAEPQPETAAGSDAGPDADVTESEIPEPGGPGSDTAGPDTAGNETTGFEAGQGSTQAAEAEPKGEPEVEGPVAVPERVSDSETAVPDEPSQLDLLYDLLGSDGYAEDSIRVFEGLSDAAAVPDVPEGAWQESEQQEYSADQTADEPRENLPADAVQPEIFADGATQDALPGAEPAPRTAPPAPPGSESEPEPQPAPEPELGPESEVEAQGPTRPNTSPEPEAAEPESESKPASRSKKRKRAAVPSWDEIMFGSPTPPKRQ